MPNPNNIKNGAAAAIPPNKEAEKTLEAEEIIKSNKSTMQQLLDLQKQNKDLKDQLIDREAKIMAMNDTINLVLTQANTDCSTLYREINKNLVVLGDIIKAVIEPQIAQNFTAIRTQIPLEKKRQLSMQYRQQENLEPLRT